MLGMVLRPPGDGEKAGAGLEVAGEGGALLEANRLEGQRHGPGREPEVAAVGLRGGFARQASERLAALAAQGWHQPRAPEEDALDLQPDRSNAARRDSGV